MDNWMKHNLLCMLLGLLVFYLLPGCRTVEQANAGVQHDSLRIEVREKTLYVRDTIYIAIPAQSSYRETRDTASHLENDYSRSDAWVTADGLLHHTLITKQRLMPVTFDKPVVRKDSTTLQTIRNTVTRTVEVEKELTFWQQMQIYGFRVLLLMALLWMLVKYRKEILAQIRKLI